MNLLVKIADVYKEKNEDLDNAIRTHERILQLVPGDADALDALESLYRENEFFEQVIQVLDRLPAQWAKQRPPFVARRHRFSPRTCSIRMLR